MQTQSVSKPELLVSTCSPAGALAALEGGADALSFGLPCGTYSLSDTSRLVPLAHGLGRKLYVALDGALREEELPRLAAFLWELGALEVDALVLHDLGLWHSCRKAFPELPLHASAGVAAHNSACVRQLETMGFARVALAPECTLPELAELGRKTKLAVEVLVQGPLCYSLSSLCLAPSLVGTGNRRRGACGEPCRRPCRSREDRTGKELHPFSPSDVSLIGRLPELTRAGVAALRIEGEGRSPAAVHAAVRAWRKVLDAPATDREGAVGAAREILGNAGERRFTEGFAFHPHPREVLDKREEPQGEEVGSVVRWKDRRVAVAPRGRLAAGDHLCFGEGLLRTNRKLVLGEVLLEKKGRRTFLTFDCPFEVRPGETVFREKRARGVARDEGFDEKWKTLPAASGRPLRLTASFSGDTLHLDTRSGPLERRFDVRLPMHEATAHPLDKGVLEKHLGRAAGTGYSLAHLAVSGPVPPVVVPPSAFKAALREVAAGLDEGARLERERRGGVVAGLRTSAPAQRAVEKRHWVRTEAFHSVKTAATGGFGRAVVPITRSSLKVRGKLLEVVQTPDRLVWELPAWIPEAELGGWRHDLEALAREGHRALCLSNLAHLTLADGLPFQLHAGRELHVWNGWAAAALRELGFVSFTVDPETDRENLRAFAAQGWPLRPVVVVYGELPLFSTRLDPDSARGVPSGGPVESSGGLELRWAAAPSARGREWFFIHGGPALAWTHRLGELSALGIEDFLFDFGGRRYSDAEVTSLLHHLETESGVPRSTEVNFGPVSRASNA